jgi:hypothetical protein
MQHYALAYLSADCGLLRPRGPLMEAWIKMAGQLTPNRASFHGVIGEAGLHHQTAKAGGPPLRLQHTRPGDQGAAFNHRSAARGTIVDAGDLDAV